MKTHLKKGDLVQVISGKEKGKQARITEVLLKHESVILEGLNVVKKHVKPSQTNPQGGIVSKEAPLHISKVMLVCPKTGEPTRVAIEVKSGKKIRISKKGGVPIP